MEFCPLQLMLLSQMPGDGVRAGVQPRCRVSWWRSWMINSTVATGIAVG
jgi:hypothetical protein